MIKKKEDYYYVLPGKKKGTLASIRERGIIGGGWGRSGKGGGSGTGGVDQGREGGQGSLETR